METHVGETGIPLGYLREKNLFRQTEKQSITSWGTPGNQTGETPNQGWATQNEGKPNWQIPTQRIKGWETANLRIETRSMM